MDNFKRATALPGLSKYTPKPKRSGYELVAQKYPIHKQLGNEIHLISPTLMTVTITRAEIENNGGSFDCFLEWLERTDYKQPFAA